MKITIEKRAFPLAQPFIITGYQFDDVDTVWVTLEDGGFTGRGEGVGIYYAGENSDTMYAQLEAIVPEIEKGLTFDKVQALLPHGGARNALDCALWDLQSKKSGKSIWQMTGITPREVTTVATVGIASPEKMAADALAFAQYPNLKIKLSGDDPIRRITAIRQARPDAKLVIDVNQGWNFAELQDYIPEMAKLGVAMIEQPLPRGMDEELVGFTSPVPLGGDESCLTLEEYDQFADRYDIINIKLDKCGGLTEALAIARKAQAEKKGLMVGNMTGTSLSMAPAYVIAQFCDFVDIDGPILLSQDIDNALTYKEGGIVSIPTPDLWG
ncbi:dipeptide epimerase [Kordiimonas sediminis]|uniref:Dipeptide epimerase n=1 Tax=Kordiimonas sediminis TaxID=1735581 RepID=A0A919AY14_9PROT|nr:dipeptide epimerase [Kordiimonas sediminis]GHF28958.1 dipeptide epimerase [Kordiimonas sediminis]